MGRPMFVPPIYGGPSGIVDEGAMHTRGAPIMCTEFGGVNVTVKHGGGSSDWGYTTANDAHDLLRRFEEQLMAVVDGGLVCAFVWTQFTDVEQEVNGLYTYDRKEKTAAAGVKDVIAKARHVYYSKLAER
nr:hypothetical protein CFP56_20871 [Quercus suber]